MSKGSSLPGSAGRSGAAWASGAPSGTPSGRDRRREQAHHRFLLPGRDELGLHVETELAGQQPPRGRDLPGPGGARDIPRDQVTGRGRPADPGQREQPAALRGLGGTALSR